MLGITALHNGVRPVVFSAEFLPSNPKVRVRIPAGSGILISILEVLFMSRVVSGGEPDIVLYIDPGSPALVYLSSVLVHSLLLPLQASHPQTFGL